MKVYHISDKKLPSIKLNPRIPQNYMTNNGFEDNTTERVCVSKNIDGALKAMSVNLQGKQLHVYSLDVPDSEVYKPTAKEVPDGFITKELWIKKPVVMKYEKSIDVGKAKDKGFNYKYGDNVATLYGWNFADSYSFGSRDNTRISKIQSAGASQTMLKIKYKDKQGKLSERIVEPYKLVGNDFWAYDPSKESIRRFKVKNLQSMINTNKKFDPRWPIEIGDNSMMKTSQLLDCMIEKTALTKDEILDQFSKSFNKIDNRMIDNSKTTHTIVKTPSLPWNENYLIETGLRNHGGDMVTEDYWTLGNNEDDTAVSRIRGKGKPFSKKNKTYTVVADQIAVKNKYKKQGIGRDFFNSVEDAGRNLGATKLALVPDAEGVRVWPREEFGMHISKENKAEFLKEYKKFQRKNKTQNLQGETQISKYPKNFVEQYLKDRPYMTVLEKHLT